MISGLVNTFRELGDATSRNLEFSHCGNVYVSYGEETITETNLLEIRRRHTGRVRLETFSKKKEAQNGADFDWHIIGNKWTLKMRVQAKRAQRDGRLNIKYRVRSSGKQQRDLLLRGSNAVNMIPLYCIYCTEPQRGIWNQSHPEEYQYGCLLADATDVPLATTKLCEFECKCIPWHFLFEHERWLDIPTVADLNGAGDDVANCIGVHETSAEEFNRDLSPQVGFTKTPESEIHRLLVIDVGDRKQLESEARNGISTL